MLKNLSDVISNNLLWNLRDGWLELDKSRFQRGRLSLRFFTVPEASFKVPFIVRLQPPLVEVTENDDNRKVLMRLDRNPALKSSCIYRLLLFSAAG